MRCLLLTAIWAAAGAQPYSSLLTPWGTDSIRVQLAAPGNDIADPPAMALLPSAPASRTSSAYSADQNTLTNGNLRVTLDPSTSLLTATRVSDGAVLLKQTQLLFAAPNVPVTRANSFSATATFAAVANEKIYGLGEHRTGSVQMKPFSKRFADSQDYGQSHGSDVSIPWYASSLGYGFVWNSPAYGYVNVSDASTEWFANATLGVDMWITTTSVDFDPSAGVSPFAQLLSNYVDAVGHASTMPFYSTGFVQCKDRYRNQTQLLEVARGYVDRELPISVIVIDWQHWVHQGDWQLNPACWPDPQGMVDELSTLGIETMVTFWPFQTTGSINWNQFSSSGYLVPDLNGSARAYDGDQYLVDEFNPEVRQTVFEKFWQGYGRFGIKTVWIDAAEPEHFGSQFEGTWRYLAGTDAEVGEAWVQQHARMLQEGFASKGIEPGDYFILPRHAWAGTWRYSAALWSGDIESSFDELALQIKVLQGVMMSGVALWTTDIGGYFGGNPADAQFQELIVRWFQFGAFSPLFRLHGHRDGGPPSNECGPTNGDNEVWNLATEPAHYAGIVAVMHLRENLRQYVSDINRVAAETGFPMIRPMFLQWPLDPNCQGADVEDQFMFGSSWLVAPVYTYQAASRTVYLPQLNNVTHEWVMFFGEISYGAGGSRVTVATTNVTEFPLFFIRPIIPPAPPATAKATSFFSAERNDQVLCVDDQCYSANAPGQDGHYSTQRVEGIALLNDDGSGHVEINGVTYPTAPLTLYYSFTHTDNFVSTNSTPPDASYKSGTVFQNGVVLAAPAPGALPLQVWFKKFAGESQDYASVASAEGVSWAQSNGYTLVDAGGATGGGWVLPNV